jgi:hypothetical protein
MSTSEPWNDVRHGLSPGMKATISRNRGRESYYITAEIIEIHDNGQIRLHYINDIGKEQYCVIPWWRLKLQD